MNIKKIREQIEKKSGKNLKFKFNGIRNQTEEFSGKIIHVYPAIFTIEVNDITNTIKSFTYSDVLTNNLEIYEKDINYKE